MSYRHQPTVSRHEIGILMQRSYGTGSLVSLDLYDVLGQCTWGQNRLLAAGDTETINTVA